ncbi:MAG: bifunctional oligoribonuclease/PAP phosphatase NrnA [Planctomycetota bacterium]
MHSPLRAAEVDQEPALALLRTSRQVLLTGHERPDGDCVGAQAALAGVLTALGKSVRVLNPDRPEPRFRELLDEAVFTVDDGGPLPPHDLIVMLDGGDLGRTGALSARFQASDAKKLVIDHHVHDGDAWWDAAYVDVRASATGLLVYRLSRALAVTLDPRAARGVFTSLVTDTGWFRYSNADAETFEVAAALIGAGVRPFEIYRDIYQRQPQHHPRSLGSALGRTEFYLGGRIAVVDLPLSATSDAPTDGDEVLDTLRSVDGVEVALVVRAVDPQRSKLSARAKGDCDVRLLAAAFGGGGHVKAAGATIHEPLVAARAKVLQAALEMYGPQFATSAVPGGTSQ